MHEVVAWVLLAMVALHVVAVIVMSVLERENLVRAMVTGYKPKARHPGAQDAIAPGAVALLVGATVFAGTAYSILQYDADAFTLRSAESYEHRVGNKGEAMGDDVGEADEDSMRPMSAMGRKQTLQEWVESGHNRILAAWVG